MNRSDDIEIIKTRLRLAMDYTNDLKASLERFTFSAPSKIAITDIHQNGEGFTYVIKCTELKSTEHLRIQFSTVIHHLRATCDNIVFSLGANSVSNIKKLKFPITTFESGGQNSFVEWASQCKGLSDEVLSIIKSLQPFNSYSGDYGTVTMGDHPLSILHELSVRDKHRSLSMVVSKQTGIQYRATGEDHVNSMIDIGSLGKDIKLGYKVGAIRTKKGHLRNDIEIGMPACVLIDEQNVPANLCDPVMLLIYMHDFIRDEVVSKLEPFLCSPARPEDKG